MTRIDSLAGLTIGDLDVTVGDLGGVTYAGLGGLTYADLDVTYADLGDDHPVGALLTLASPTETEEDRIRAAHRLARTWFTRPYVFHPDRWALLRDAFNRERGDRTYQEAWEDLAVPEIIAAVAPYRQGGRRLSQLYDDVRRHLRQSVERLLLGRTTDSGEAFHKLTANPPDAEAEEDILELAELRLDALLRLHQLPPEERGLLLAYQGVNWHDLDAEDYAFELADPAAHRAKLAADLGITPASLRKRIERIRQKVTD